MQLVVMKCQKSALSTGDVMSVLATTSLHLTDVKNTMCIILYALGISY
jgi:hypothetical protein